MLNDIAIKLYYFWEKFDCNLVQPMELEIADPLYNSNIFFNMLGNNIKNSMFVQKCFSAKDFLGDKNINKIGNYSKFQVVLRSENIDYQTIFIDSLRHLGINTLDNNITFKTRNLEKAVFGIDGFGFNVLVNNNYLGKIIYIQRIGSINCKTIPISITYNIEQIAQFIQNTNSIWDILVDNKSKTKYSEIAFTNEKETADFINSLDYHIMIKDLINCEITAIELLNKNLILPAYKYILKTKYYLDLINCRNILSHTDKIMYTRKIRALVENCCREYILKTKEGI